MSIIGVALRNVSKIIGSNSMGTALETVLDTFERARLNEEALYWDFYNGRFYTSPGENGHLPYVNLVRGKVQKSIAWLVGEPPAFSFRKDIHVVMDELSKEIIENSGGDKFFYDVAEMGGVTGNAILYPQFNAELNNGLGGVSIKVLESDKTFLEYRNVNNKKILSKVMLLYEELDEVGNLIINVEVWDKDNVEVYSKNESMLPRGFSPHMIVPVEFRPVDIDLLTNNTYNAQKFQNPYGELPFVHILNLPSSNSIMGRSDIQDDWIINEELNEQLLSYKDNADYHGNPLTLMYGISAKNLEKGAGKVWGNLPTDSRVENLEVTQTFEMIQIYMDMLLKYGGLGGIPSYILSLDKELTADTSNAAMRLAFLPIIEYTNVKKISYGAGFKAVMEMSLRMLNNIMQLNLQLLDSPDNNVNEKMQTFLEKFAAMGIPNPQEVIDKITQLRNHPFFECTVVFKDHLPRNRALELVDIQTELGMKLESIDGAMTRLGITDIESKKKEIEEGAIYSGRLDRLATIFADIQNPLPPELGGGEEGEEGEDAGEMNAPTPEEPEEVEEESPTSIEESTGQSAERTAAQRAMRGKGDM
jgi:hypothetical protein